MREAEQICENLGFTLEEARESHQRVNEYVATLYLERGVPTLVRLADGTRVHRHQLLVGPDDIHYVALEMDDSAVQIAGIAPPMPLEDGPGMSDVGFLETRAITHGRLMMEYEPQVTENGEPVWGY